MKALKIFACVGLVGLLLVIPIWFLSNRAAKTTAMDQIIAARDAKKVDLALKLLERYNVDYPLEIAGLEMRAELLSDSAIGIDGLIQAAQINDQLLRLDPSGKDRRETKRRLVRLYIRHGNELQRYFVGIQAGGDETRELRYKAAATLAQELTATDPKDADAHRLLAQAYDGLLSTGSKAKLSDAVASYTEALRLNPNDIQSAERLAMIDLQQLGDRVGAEAILDQLLKTRPDDPEVRMARFRFFTAAKEPEKAQAEVAATVAMLPTNASVRIVAASDALRRSDLEAARGHLDAIPAARQDDPGVRLIRGEIDLYERHPDQAIERYRTGLIQTGGTDQDLTWRLARTLILLGRTAEAKPVVDRFEQLEGEDRLSLVRYLRGLMEAATKHPIEAISNLEKAVELVPKELRYDIQMTLGRCHEELGSEIKALSAYRKASEAMPRAAEPHRAISRLIGAKDPQGSLNELERALSRTAGDPGLLAEVGRGRLALELAKPADRRDWASLKRFLDEADRLAPGRIEFLALRLDYLAGSDQLEAAKDLAEAATKGPERKRPEAWQYLVAVLRRQNKVDEALEALEAAAAPDAVGDLAAFRITRAELLVNSGRGREARDVLTKDVDRVPKSGRPELVKALGLLLRGLGDRPGALAALSEWARMIPDNPQPGLILMEIALADDDDEAARLGLAALKAVGGEQIPYALAARALEILRVRQGKPNEKGSRPRIEEKKLQEATALVEQLQALAPDLPIVPLLRGMVMDESGNATGAIDSFKLALKEPTFGAALSGLLEVLTRQKMYGDIETLKRRYQTDPALAKTFDRISAAVSLKFGDKGRAEQAVAKIVEMEPENLSARTGLAKILDEMGQPEKAEAIFRELISLQPENGDAWTSLVIYQVFRGATADAIKTVDRLRAGYRGPLPDLLEARCRWAIGDMDRAAKLYADAVARRPYDLTTLRAAITFQDATGRSAESEPALRQVLKLDPRASWAARTLARNLASRNSPESWAEAWSLIKPGSDSGGSTPEDRLVRSIVLASSPDPARRAEAEPTMAALADDLPSSNPIAIEARCRLARSKLDAGLPAEAERYIAPAAEDANPNIMALAISVEALCRTGQLDVARRRVEKMVATDGKSPRVAIARAWVLHASADPAGAARTIEDLVTSDPASASSESTALIGYEALLKMGQAADAGRLAALIGSRWPRDAHLAIRYQIGRGNAAGALNSCRVALAAGSAREVAREGASMSIQRRDDPEFLKSLDEIMTEAASKAPKTFDVPIYLATLRHIQGRYREEIDLYRETLVRKPVNFQFLNNMAWTLSEGLHDYDEALARIDEVIRREGTTAAYLDTRGVILFRLGKLEESIADLEESSRQSPDSTTYLHLARAYKKAGKPDQLGRCRDLARKAKLDPATLDPTDKADLAEVMGPS